MKHLKAVVGAVVGLGVDAGLGVVGGVDAGLGVVGDVGGVGASNVVAFAAIGAIALSVRVVTALVVTAFDKITIK